VAASSEADKFTNVPAYADWKLNKNASYLHICTNETIHGVEFDGLPEAGNVPIVADMSSHILSRSIDVTKYGVIYGALKKHRPCWPVYCHRA